jgi:hypothetical protein
MAVLKRIGPGSVFKVGLIVYGTIGLIIGIFISLFSLLGASLGMPGQPRAFGALFGALAIVFMPICYGIFGATIAALVAALCNLAAGWVGGLEVDIN